MNLQIAGSLLKKNKQEIEGVIDFWLLEIKQNVWQNGANYTKQIIHEFWLE